MGNFILKLYRNTAPLKIAHELKNIMYVAIKRSKEFEKIRFRKIIGPTSEVMKRVIPHCNPKVTSRKVFLL